MKKWLFALLLCTSCTFSLVNNSVITDSRAFDTTGISQINITNFVGSVRIRQGSPSILIRQYGQVDIGTWSTNNTLNFKAQAKVPSCLCGVELEVSLPSGINLSVTTDSGSIRIAQMTGSLIAKTSSGSLDISQHQGSLEASTGSGSVTLTDIRFFAGSQNSANTGSGTITAINLQSSAGLTIRGRTSSGSLALVLPDYVIERSNTSFVAAKAGTNPASLEFSTRSGSISVE